MPAKMEHSCKNCGNTHNGLYCPQCGQIVSCFPGYIMFVLTLGVTAILVLLIRKLITCHAL
jgi:hypothetical protein